MTYNILATSRSKEICTLFQQDSHPRGAGPPLSSDHKTCSGVLSIPLSHSHIVHVQPVYPRHDTTLSHKWQAKLQSQDICFCTGSKSAVSRKFYYKRTSGLPVVSIGPHLPGATLSVSFAENPNLQQKQNPCCMPATSYHRTRNRCTCETDLFVVFELIIELIKRFVKHFAELSQRFILGVNRTDQFVL